MAFQNPDRSPISPSFTSNPFDKYKNARGGFPEGVGGIGTGSNDRFSSRKKVGERKRIVRVLVAAFLVGFVVWFLLTPLNWTGGHSSGEIYVRPGTTSHDGSAGGSVAKENAEGDLYVKPSTPEQHISSPVGEGASSPGSLGSDRVQVGKEKASFVMLIRYANSSPKSMWLLCLTCD